MKIALVVIGYCLGAASVLAAERYCARRFGRPAPSVTASLFSAYGITWGIAGAVIASSVTMQFGLQPAAFVYGGFAWILLFIARVDWLESIIPNSAVIAAFALRAAFFVVTLPYKSGAAEAFGMSLAGLVVIGGGVALVGVVASKITGRTAIGAGDVKLFAVAGFYFGVALGLMVVFVSCILALFFHKVFERGRKEPFPFGPSIAAASIIAIII